jgi:inner membrane protein
MLLWAALSMLPDADVIGFRLGVKYADPWGHRGATHSFCFALGVACLLGALAPRFARGALRTAVFAWVVVGSHAILDTLTDGGLGCALWWPFDHQRYFAPFHPIPVAPIGRHFFSSVGLTVARSELLLFSPLFVYALWPRERRAAPADPTTE